MYTARTTRVYLILSEIFRFISPRFIRFTSWQPGFSELVSSYLAAALFICRKKSEMHLRTLASLTRETLLSRDTEEIDVIPRGIQQFGEVNSVMTHSFQVIKRQDVELR